MSHNRCITGSFLEILAHFGDKNGFQIQLLRKRNQQLNIFYCDLKDYYVVQCVLGGFKFSYSDCH